MHWLFAGFAVIWIVLFLYLLSLGRKQAALSREIENLKSKLERAPE